MHSSEWIADAKRVPVGQHRRVYHGAERRPNLVVWNNEDSWSAYCHSCHKGAKVRKELLQKVDVSAPVFRKYLNLKDCCTFDVLARKHPWKYSRVVQLLHEKRMSTVLLRPHGAMYNLVDDRLVLQFDGVHLGRDCTGKSPAKWLHYHHDSPKGVVYLRGEKTIGSREPVILTEDMFSAIKINHYTKYSTMCILGTRITDEVIGFFIRAVPPLQHWAGGTQAIQRSAVTAFDGDLAGHRAVVSLRQRFRLYGLSHYEASIPDGLDPKDLNHLELNQTFKFLENNHGVHCTN